MKLLLDTCTFLWLAADDPQLSASAKDACTDPVNDVYLSALSAWEMSIKYRLGRLPLPLPPHEYVSDRRQRLLVDALPFDESAACRVHQLPRHHRDPFDRGLVAQAIASGATLVTPDPWIRQYPASTLW